MRFLTGIADLNYGVTDRPSDTHTTADKCRAQQSNTDQYVFRPRRWSHVKAAQGVTSSRCDQRVTRSCCAVSCQPTHGTTQLPIRCVKVVNHAGFEPANSAFGGQRSPVLTR
jgi:hypothetical protein